MPISFKLSFYTTILALLSFHQVQSQRLTRDELKDTIFPSFSIYKDTYFITGVPTHTGISKETADAKYQISFKQLITRHTLPFNTQLFITYTQKSFWDVYAFSSPFQEVNFNPGIGFGKPLFNNGDKLVGLTEFKIEHESNGRDSIYSRSWNSISLSYHTRISKKTLLSIKTWFPFSYKSDNPKLIKYIGYGEINLVHNISNDLQLELNAKKGNQWNWKGSLRSRLIYSIAKRTNQYIMLEWFNGYGENLIAFDKYRSMLRIGYIIRSTDLQLLKPAQLR